MTTVAQQVAETRLDLWLEQAPRSWSDILVVFIDVGQKLAAAHAAGTIHEEIRMENVVVLSNGHGDVRDLKPALLDLPKIGPGSPRTSAVSLEQRLAEMKSTESVAYLAPEQFRGRSADARSNQFSFCVALYRAVYRHVPFDHEWAVSQAGESRRTPLGSIHFDLLIQSFDRSTLINLAREVLSGNLRPPPEETDVPVWLDLVLRRGLQTDPEDRYPSMRQLLSDVQQHFRKSTVPSMDGDDSMIPRWAIPVGVVAVSVLGLLGMWLAGRP